MHQGVVLEQRAPAFKLFSGTFYGEPDLIVVNIVLCFVLILLSISSCVKHALTALKVWCADRLSADPSQSSLLRCCNHIFLAVDSRGPSPMLLKKLYTALMMSDVQGERRRLERVL